MCSAPCVYAVDCPVYVPVVEPVGRENPATVFMAHHLAETVNRIPWAELHADVRDLWMDRVNDLILAMYQAGFTIPQPDDPDAVWAALLSEHA